MSRRSPATERLAVADGVGDSSKRSARLNVATAPSYTDTDVPISPLDDYPVHQTPVPVAHMATGDPNHYDRYWFNGYDVDGEWYFGVAMGVYPNRGIIDAAFSILRDGDAAFGVRIRTAPARPARDEDRSDLDRGRRTAAHDTRPRRRRPPRHHRRPRVGAADDRGGGARQTLVRGNHTMLDTHPVHAVGHVGRAR